MKPWHDREQYQKVLAKPTARVLFAQIKKIKLVACLKPKIIELSIMQTRKISRRNVMI